jgi:hypothetical protein
VPAEENVDWEAIDRELEAILGPPVDAPKVFAASRRILDDIFASRTHVRLMRVFATTDPRINLTARDVARRAGVSHARALQALRQLVSIGIVATHQAVSYRCHWYEEEHPLGGVIRALFEEEHQDESRGESGEESGDATRA